MLSTHADQPPTPGNPSSTPPPPAAPSPAGLTGAEAQLINQVLERLQAQTGHDLRHYRAENLTAVPFGLDFWQALADRLAPAPASTPTLDAYPAEQQQMLEAILYNIPAAVYMLTTDHRYLLVNRVYEEENQITNAAIRGLSVYDRWPAPYADQLTAIERQVLANKAPIAVEEAVERAGELYHYATVKAPLLDAQGEPYAIIGISTDITARKRAEEALRHSEARFRQLAEAMPQIVWAAAPDGTLTYINEQWQRYSGMTFAQTIAEGMWPALHPADQATNDQIWQQAVATGQPYEAELRLRRWDGVYRWHLERAVPVRNGEGIIEQWFGATVDIDDQKQAQAALSAANERFALAEHASNGWVYDFDVRRGTAERSPGFCRLLGYAPEELPNDVRWWHDLFHPDDRYLTESPSVNRRRDADFAEVEYRVRHRDGHYIHVLDRSRNIHDASGQRIRVVGITVDISARKRAEHHQQFLSRLGLQLRLLGDLESIIAQLVSSIGQHLGVALCRLNTIDREQQQFRIEQEWPAASDGAAHWYPLTELAPPALLAELEAGQTVVINNTATDPRTAPNATNYQHTQTSALIGVPIFHQGHWSATLSVREPQPRSWHRDEVTLLETVATQFQPLLEKVRMEQALRVSEERLRQFNEQLEERVRERTAQLEHSNRELDQFAYVASHDLKAPLRGIEHLANWIMEDSYAVLPETSRSHLLKLRERVQRMERLLNDLLAYSRVGRRDGEPERVATEALVNDIVALLAPPAGFTVQIVGPLPRLVTPKAPLETVLRNLIANALKHHPSPTTGTVWVSALEVGDFVQFCVRDDGPGIAPAYHERIFGLFQTLQPRDQVEGSGIGLALVKKAVEARGGKVWIESEGEGGAAFYFTWPKVVSGVEG